MVELSAHFYQLKGAGVDLAVALVVTRAHHVHCRLLIVFGILHKLVLAAEYLIILSAVE